jgi:Holliday junction resolvase RusA-like endonuclease
VKIEFRFPRHNSHFGTGKNVGKLKASAPKFVAVKPDVDKLIRAVLDALTDAGVFRDDSRVVQVSATKIYADKPGALIFWDTLDETPSESGKTESQCVDTSM